MIRKRLCQFLAKFLLKLSVDAYLDCKICDIIIEIMTERIKVSFLKYNAEKYYN